MVLLDRSGRVLDLVKVKTHWYVLLRATREKVAWLKPGCTEKAIENVCDRIEQRLRVLHRAMSIPAATVERFIAIGAQFARWLGRSAKRLENLRDQYPSLFLSFLQDHHLPNTDALLTSSLPGSLRSSSSNSLKNSNNIAAEEGEEAKVSHAPLLVLMQGMPGCGKR